MGNTIDKLCDTVCFPRQGLTNRSFGNRTIGWSAGGMLLSFAILAVSLSMMYVQGGDLSALYYLPMMTGAGGVLINLMGVYNGSLSRNKKDYDRVPIPNDNWARQ